MKNYTVLLILVLFSLGVQAQTLTMSDLTNLASLNNSDAHTNLTYERPFRELYTQNINGLAIVHYQGSTPASKGEVIIIGYGIKNSEGTFLHTVTYTSTNTKYLLSLVGQAKSAGLNKEFSGADADKNIYLFSNFLYNVTVYINTDNKLGSVEIKQNDNLDYP